MAKLGRPKTVINREEFEKLCGLQCTEEEICGFFDCSDKTLAKWCKDEYEATFSEVFSQKRNKGKISLRRNQWKLSEKSAAMAIWLGKQYLGQKDNTDNGENSGESKAAQWLEKTLTGGFHEQD